MAYNRSLIFVLTVIVSMVAAPAYATDELFDTATALKHIEQGISFLKTNNFDAAISQFDESASIAPEAEAYYYLGYAYYMKSRKKDGDSRRLSLENFKKAYEIDPNFSPTRYNPSEPAPQMATTMSTTVESAAPETRPQPDVPQAPAPEQSKP